MRVRRPPRSVFRADGLPAAEVYAMSDSLGDVGAGLSYQERFRITFRLTTCHRRFVLVTVTRRVKAQLGFALCDARRAGR
jgi:hypothetical protein